MVRLKGPSMATSATGSLADTLIYSSNKGRAYVKKAAKPKQPRSPAQVSLRRQMDFHSKEWKSICAADQATWDELSAQTRVSPFNAFQAYNLSRLRDHQRPTMAFPAAETGGMSSFAGVVVTPGPRCLHLEIQCTIKLNTWALYMWEVANTGLQPTWNQLINIRNVYSVATHKWTLRHQEPRTFWWTWTQGSDSGRTWVAGTWRQTTIPN